MLDDLKLGMLDGSLDGSTLSGSRSAADGLAEGSGDPGLDAVLGEIELRVAVELAKAGSPAGPQAPLSGVPAATADVIELSQ